MPQAGTEHELLGDDPDELRRRIRELELENALMREAVRGRKKTRAPTCGACRTGRRRCRRPAEAEVFAEVDGLLAAVSRPAATTTTTRERGSISTGPCALRRRVADVFRESRGRYGYRRVKAALGTGTSEQVIRRIMREDGLVAHVPGRRRYSSYEGEVTPAPDNLVNRDFTAPAPNVKWLTDTTRDQGP